MDYCRVQSIAAASSLEDVDLSPLRKSINKLHASSVRLDKEKYKAERALKRVIKSIIRRRIFKRNARQAICEIKKIFGKKCECPHKNALHMQAPQYHDTQDHRVPNTHLESGSAVKPRIGRYPGWLSEQREKERAHRRHDKKHVPYKRLKKAIKRVQAVNAKLVSFERGLIHPDGIKDREWYRHLGVAPGKWLGTSYAKVVCCCCTHYSRRLWSHYTPCSDRVVHD